MTLSLRDLQLVFERMTDGVVVAEPPRIVEVNPALCALLQCRHKLVEALPLTELVHEDDRPKLAALLAGEALAEGPLRVRLPRSDGTSVPCSLRAERSGRTWFLFFRTLRDFDEDLGEPDAGSRNAAPRVRDIEESRNRYRQIVENLADGLVTLSDRHEFLWINKPFASMLGFRARSTLVARPFLDFVVDRDRDRVGRGMMRWDRGDVARFEASLRHTDGSEVPVLLSGRALPRARPGGPARLLVLVTDFAERQALSERLVLARKMDALSTLAGGIAHDFNNLLTGILGNTSRIRLARPGEDIDALAKSVEDSADLAARLTQKLMALVRGQAPHRHLLDVADLVGHTVALIEKVLPDSIRLETSYARDLPPVLADESQLQQAILNLCINARDAMMDLGGGTLSVSVRGGVLVKPLDDGTSADERAVVLEVADTGPGVPRDLRDRIFDPFFTTKGLGRGIGLGLSTVYNLVDAHGGTIDLDDAPGGGARFTLRLPSRPGSRVEPRQRAVAAPAQGPCRGTILLAEDEAAIRNLVASSLGAEGFVVLAAKDGEEAARIWTERRDDVDLLFLDVRMPGLDGPDVLRLARRDRPGVPAVFSSGYIPDDDPHQERLEGVIFLPKPYRVPDLLVTVRSALGDIGSGATTAVTPIDGVSSIEAVSTGDLPAFRAGQAIDMSSTLMDAPPVTEDLDPIMDE